MIVLGIYSLFCWFWFQVHWIAGAINLLMLVDMYVLKTYKPPKKGKRK